MTDLATFIAFLHPMLHKVEYIVVQTGAKIQGIDNTNTLDTAAAEEMIKFCHSFGIKAKEHNGDFLPNDSITQRFQLGLNSINIGPELGILETTTILESMSQEDANTLINMFVDSNKWERWLPANSPRRAKAVFAGHYLYNDPKFLRIKYKYPKLNHRIIRTVICRIKEKYEATQCEK